jgi:hypothetical protein
MALPTFSSHSGAGATGLSTLAILGVLFTTQSAFAFRTGSDLAVLKSSAAVPVNWAISPIPYRINSELPRGVSSEDMATAVTRAASAWGAPVCSGAAFSAEGFTSAPAAPGDHINTVQWLFSGWKEHGFPADAAGATDILYEKDTSGAWRIVEADVYLNATARDWILEAPVPDGKWDLLSAITHEFGHFAGLLHPCELEPMAGVSLCDGSLPMAATTMYPTYSSDESSLEADDVDGICALYPLTDCGDSCPEGTLCTKQGCQTPCGDQMCNAGEVCENETCIRPEPASPCDSSSSSPSCPSACERNADCMDGLVCESGACHRPLAAIGDACDVAEQCDSGTCNEMGSCVPTCSSDADCTANGSCQTHEGVQGKVCSSRALPFGASCSSADDCASAQCLVGYTKLPECTRLCGADDSSARSCPEGWGCTQVDERSICAPRGDSGGCACRMQKTESPASTSCLNFMLLLGGLGLRRQHAMRAVRRQHCVKGNAPPKAV